MTQCVYDIVQDLLQKEVFLLNVGLTQWYSEFIEDSPSKDGHWEYSLVPERLQSFPFYSSFDVVERIFLPFSYI